ncbi:MAG: exodeoxyribonuclease VII large subunit [Pseudomonadota bacterium]|nr:exodeoxyribonuclease VII large subunit [Pseudomonadota bacterium]
MSTPESHSDAPASAASNVAEYTVTELSGQLKRTVEDAFGLVRVRGEISGYRGPHSSGHCYFSLKDDRARLEAVIWRGVFSKLRHRPEDGMEVIATGKLTTYPGSSKYQIVVDNIEPAGAGALMALLEERKRKLGAEGLFDETRKRPLPYLPSVIGVVTSPTGAVIRDVLHRISDRYPLHVIVWPVRVQGETSGQEVARAIAGFNALTPDGPIARPDLIVVARGGGSIEDLWGFNDESVVRAVAASEIPLISAIGHETDWTLIDLAADRRAPTPTGAAEIAVPVKAELEAFVATLTARLRAGLRRALERARSELRSAERDLGTPADILSTPRQRLDAAADRLSGAMRLAVQRKRSDYGALGGRLNRRLLDSSFARARERLKVLDAAASSAYRNRVAARRQQHENARRRLDWRLLARTVKSARDRLDQNWRLIGSLSHERVLARGFALIRDAGGAPILSADAVQAGDALSVQMHDGSFGAVAVGASRGGDPGKGKAGTARQQVEEPAGGRKTKGGEQGSLF